MFLSKGRASKNNSGGGKLNLQFFKAQTLKVTFRPVPGSPPQFPVLQHTCCALISLIETVEIFQAVWS